MSSVAIIPARSGSKGLQDKNIKNINGKPLLAYSIEAALESECFDEIMVSTDSEEYAEISKKYGANVPFFRSINNSSDTASSWDMVAEVLNNYSEKGIIFDDACLLQPTSPLRSAEDICNAYSIFYEKASVAVVSVCNAEHSPHWIGKLPKNREFIGFIDKDDVQRRQDLGEYYRLNGAIYIINISRFWEDRFLFRKGSFAYVMPQIRSVDIDTELDFQIAEFLMNQE